MCPFHQPTTNPPSPITMWPAPALSSRGTLRASARLPPRVSATRSRTQHGCMLPPRGGRSVHQHVYLRGVVSMARLLREHGASSHLVLIGVGRAAARVLGLQLGSRADLQPVPRVEDLRVARGALLDAHRIWRRPPRWRLRRWFLIRERAPLSLQLVLVELYICLRTSRRCIRAPALFGEQRVAREAAEEPSSLWLGL